MSVDVSLRSKKCITVQCSAMRRKQLTVKYVSLPLAHNCAQHRALNSKVRKILLFWDINFIIQGRQRCFALAQAS